MSFTTRPELVGTFGMATSTHWIASAVGMKLLEAGGTAADAAVGVGLRTRPHQAGVERTPQTVGDDGIQPLFQL